MAKKIVDETLKFDIIINGDKAKKEYGQLTRENRKLLDANKDLEEQAKKLEKANQQNSEEYAQLRREIEQNNRVVQQNESRLKDLTQEIGINNLSMRQLSQEARRLNGILSNLDPESEKWREYNEQLQTVKARMGNLRQEMRPVEESMEDQLESLGKLSAGFGQFFSSLRTGDYRAAAQGLGTIRDGISQATTAALRFVATPVGAIIAVIAGIGYAAKEWFSYNSAVVDSIRLTEEITRLQGEQAQAVRLQAEAMEQTYGVEFKETLETARNLSRQFNITFTEALDDIEKGLIKGQKNNSEYFDSLREYPTFFSSAGFSVSEFRKVVETGYDLGVYSDKLPDAIKEFDLSMREQTKSTREALINAFGAAFTDDLLERVKRGESTTKEALSEIALESERVGLNIQQNAQLTADVFRGAGEDVGGAVEILGMFNTALNETDEALTPLQQRIKDVADANKELAEAQDAALRSDRYVSMANSLELFWIKVKVLFFQGVKFITDNFSRINEELTIFALQTVASIQAFPSLAKVAFTEFKDQVWDVVKTMGGLGEVVENLFAFNFDAARESFQAFKSNFSREVGDVVDVGRKSMEFVSKLRENVRAGVEERFANERAAAAEQTAISGRVQPSGSGINPDNGNSLEPEDKKKADSRRRLYEILDQMEEERAIQEQLKKVEKDQRAEEEEVLRIEAKFQKLAEQAEGEADLLARLEEEKEEQIQDVRDKYAKERFEKDTAAKKKLAEADSAFKDRLIQAEQKLNEARRSAVNQGLNILQGFVSRSSALGKALFIIQRTLAIANIIKDTSIAVASAKSNEAKIPFFIATPTGIPVPNPGKPFSLATTAKQIAAMKLTAGTQIASIVGQTIQGFEDGLYPVTRRDGRKFNARFGGNPSTQVVPVPTHFIAGEAKPEMIIDGDTFRRMDPGVTDYILGLAGKRTAGFEDGHYPGSQQNTEILKAVNATIGMLNDRLSSPLMANVLYGAEASRKQQEYDKKIKAIRQNAKIRSDAV